MHMDIGFHYFRTRVIEECKSEVGELKFHFNPKVREAPHIEFTSVSEALINSVFSLNINSENMRQD